MTIVNNLSDSVIDLHLGSDSITPSQGLMGAVADIAYKYVHRFEKSEISSAPLRSTKPAVREELSALKVVRRIKRQADKQSCVSAIYRIKLE